MTLILSNVDVEALLTMPECIDALEVAYRELAEGRCISRTRSDSLTPTARKDAVYSLKSMDGVLPLWGVGAVRINSDVITWPVRDGAARREKVPAANGRWVGLVLLFSVETGEPLAIMPDGYLQRLRVGATNGLAAKYLAREDARIVGLLGSGWQAGGQLMAVAAIRPVQLIRCFSPHREHREAFAREMAARLGIETVAVRAPEEAVAGVDIVMCATSAIEPVFFERWVEPGMHLSSIKLPEIEAAAIRRCRRTVVHTREAMPMHFSVPGLNPPEGPRGKGQALAREINLEELPELPDLVAGKIPGRTSPEEATCFLNNMGLGLQFAAAGAVVYRKAKEQQRGQELPTEWFTQDVHP